MKKFWIVLIYVVLILAVIGLCIYDVIIQKNMDTNRLLRYGLIFIGIIFSIVKVASGQKQRIYNKKATYKEAYSKLIGNAFENEPKQEKQLYEAIHDFNNGKYMPALKKLAKLHRQCYKSVNYFTVYAFMGLCYDHLGLYRQAVDFYSHALQINEVSTIASNLGSCYESLGDSSLAIEYYKRAIRADESNPFPYNNIAHLYIRELQFEEALEYAQKAVELNNRMVQALKAVAICHAVLGNDEEYKTWLRKAVACGADAKSLKAYIEDLLEGIE